MALSGGGLHRRDPGGEALSDHSEEDKSLAKTILYAVPPGYNNPYSALVEKVGDIIAAAREQDRKEIERLRADVQNDYKALWELDARRLTEAEARIACCHRIMQDAFNWIDPEESEGRAIQQRIGAELSGECPHTCGVCEERAEKAEAKLAGLRLLLLEAAEMIAAMTSRPYDGMSAANLEARLREAAEEKPNAESRGARASGAGFILVAPRDHDEKA